MLGHLVPNAGYTSPAPERHAKSWLARLIAFFARLKS
jgi:hypothetical protein